MNFILRKQVKYYTKVVFKWIRLVAFAMIIITVTISSRYKLACTVSISGEEIGYVSNKTVLEEKLNELNSKSGTDNIAFVDSVVPEYSLTFISNNEKIDNEAVLAKIDYETKFTYKFYAVTMNNEQKAVVNSLEDAESLVAQMKEKYEDDLELDLGINEFYTEDPDGKVIELASATEEIENNIEEQIEENKKIASSSVNGIYLSQKPVSGYITSRFGNRESIRTHNHTGLDIAAPFGTDIKAAAGGTVITAGERGSYGNLVVIDCGNGVHIYYGHCSKLYVSVGDSIDAGDVIAAVGSTGNSTGNHLHFEIRVNGSQVNPQKYIYN